MCCEQVAPPRYSSAGSSSELTEDYCEQYSDLFRSNGFSGFVSDKVSLDRSLPDIRHPGCRSKKVGIVKICESERCLR